MKEKILEALKTKFNGVKDEILDRIATKAAKTVTTDEELTTYIEGVTFQTILDAEGDRRATDAQKTAVANYEKKHKIKDGKPVEEPKPKKEDETIIDPDTPAWAKALMESNKVLAAEVQALKGEKLADTRKGKLAELLKDAPDSIKTMYESNFSAMQFADDASFDAWLEGSKASIESITNTLRTKGAVTTPPKTGGVPQKGEVNATLKAQVEAQAKQNTTPTATILGMPSANN